MPSFKPDPIQMPQGEPYLTIPEDAVAIWSGEWNAWWRSNASGYTEWDANAGVYTRDEAHEQTRHCGPEKQISIKPHPYRGCTFYRKAAEGTIPQTVKQTLRSDDNRHAVTIEYELSERGLVVHNVKVKHT